MALEKPTLAEIFNPWILKSVVWATWEICEDQIGQTL